MWRSRRSPSRWCDWSGGTRIGAALAEFNRRWARRVLTGRATVLLVTDGLDHEAIDVLDTEMARLHRFAHRIVWLNPLLRYSGFHSEGARRAGDPAVCRRASSGS